MRIFEDNRNEEIATVICNKCKKEIKVENNIIKEGIFSAEHVFGYFSEKDGEMHSFDLCEECYDAMVRDFVIPPEVSQLPVLF